MLEEIAKTVVRKLLPQYETTLPEVVLLVCGLVFAFFIGKILQLRIAPIVKRQGAAFNKKFLLRCLKITPVFVMLLALSLLRPLVEKVLEIGNQMFFYAQNFLFAWLVAHILLIFLRKSAAMWLILLFVVPLSVLLNHQLWNEFVSVLDSWTFSFGMVSISFYRIVKSLLVAVVLYWGARKIIHLAEEHIERVNFVRPSLRSLTMKFFQIFLYVILSLWLLNILNVPLTSLAVFSGAVGIGIGFGVQRIAANLISGIIMLMEETLKEEDIVELEDGSWGTIKKTRARYTLVETFDGKEIFIPNEEFISKRVISWTHSHKRARWVVNIGVSYDSDLELAQRLMLEATHEQEGIALDPSPFCFLSEFGDSSVNFNLQFWFKGIDTNIFHSRSELLFAIWRKFKQAGIEFPYPQQDLHIRTLPQQTALQTGQQATTPAEIGGFQIPHKDSSKIPAKRPSRSAKRRND